MVIEHQAQSKWCPRCQQGMQAAFPQDVRAPVQYGPAFAAAAVYLVQQQLLPYARASEVLTDLLWSFEVQWELWPRDTGIIWLNVGDKYHWEDADLQTLRELVNREATTEEFLTALPKFSQTAISSMCVRTCGKRAIPKSVHRLDAYITREDMSVLKEYGVGLDQIAILKGAVKAREFNGEEYWSLAYTKRENRQFLFHICI